jgi:hypothetical protein
MRTKEWNCPFCEMSLNRHWNLKRHIQRQHGRMGEPISHDTEQSYKDIIPQNLSFPLGYSKSTSLPFLNRKGKSDEKFSDFLEDKILVPLRKMVEIRSLLSQLSIIQQQRIIPGGSNSIVYPSMPSTTFNSDESNNNLFEESIFDNENDSEIVGFKGHVCEKCSIISIDTIFRHNDGESGQIETNHTCNSKTLSDIQLNPGKDKIIADQHEKLIEYIKKKVNSWTKNSAYLVAMEMLPNAAANNICDITPTDENHWAARAIADKQTILNHEELSDFLHKARDSTCGFFKVLPRYDQQQESSTHHYLMIITKI